MVYMVKLSRHVGCLCDPKSRKRAEDCGKAGRGGGLGLRRAAEFESRTDAFGELGTAVIAPCPIQILFSSFFISFLLFAFLSLDMAAGDLESRSRNMQERTFCKWWVNLEIFDHHP